MVLLASLTFRIPNKYIVLKHMIHPNTMISLNIGTDRLINLQKRPTFALGLQNSPFLCFQTLKFMIQNRTICCRSFSFKNCNHLLRHFGCVQLGNLNLDFENPDFGFAIEREIRKRISTLRYLFLNFHFYRSIGKSEKGFEKLSLRTAVLHAHGTNGKKEIHEIRIWISELKSTLRTDFSEVKSVLGFCVRLGNQDLDFENLNPDFPIERTLFKKPFRKRPP